MSKDFSRLKNYIKDSELRVFDDDIKVRLSKELAIKYDRDCYYNSLKRISFWFKKLKELNIIYPSGVHQILYIYIVPDDSFKILLNFPAFFDNGKGGGKCVKCYDMDGFVLAYARSQNMFENKTEYNCIAKDVNTVHELAHVIHGEFFHKNSVICEGFADMVPLYILDLKKEFFEYKKMLASLNIEQVLSVQEIINSERNGNFGKDAVGELRMCSFRISYISSFLFVMVCMKSIEKKFSLSKVQAMQKFLEMVRQCRSVNEYLIYEIADNIQIPREELLRGKSLQLEVLKKLVK